MMEEKAPISELIRQASQIVIVSHSRPDGDAVGSLLALTLSLEQAGKEVSALLADGAPGRFRFLPGASKIGSRMPPQTDLLIALDCAGEDRLGFSALPRPIDVNIDHHPTNSRYAKINLIDPQAAATTQILYKLILQLDLSLTPEIATNLLVGLLTDTIGFRTSNVSPKVLRIAADLQERGACLPEIYSKALNQRSFVAARYWGCGLSRLMQEDGLVWSTLSLEDRLKVGYPGADDADLINILSTIEGVEIALIFIEQKGGRVKVSWRSRDGLDVSKLAQRFGGGGHEPAAGAMVSGTLEEVRAQVLTATRDILNPSTEP